MVPTFPRVLRRLCIKPKVRAGYKSITTHFRRKMGSQDKKSLKVTIFLRDGKTTELTEDVSAGGGDAVDLKMLSKSLLTLQTRTNDELTKLVDQEKASRAVSCQQNNNAEDITEEGVDEDDEEDDAEDDDDDEDEEPPKKQQKR